ncbi:hypothetical protein D3C75_1004730 [compost metagenome]
MRPLALPCHTRMRVTASLPVCSGKRGQSQHFGGWLAPLNELARAWDEVAGLFANLSHAEIDLTLSADTFLEKGLKPLALRSLVGFFVWPRLAPCRADRAQLLEQFVDGRDQCAVGFSAYW